MITAIRAALAADTTLTTTATGGVHDATEISRQATPSAFDGNKELKPCVLVNGESQTPWGPHWQSARIYVTLWFYARDRAAIRTMLARCYALLHRTQITPDADAGCFDIRHANDLVDQEDADLGVPMAMSRYVCTISRI